MRADDTSTTSMGYSSSGLQSDDQSPGRRPAEPAAPPFAPPERVKTPEGVPRWPGERRTSQQAHIANATRDGLFARLRNRKASNLRLRDVFRHQASGPGPASRSFWRPPVSGHMTPGYRDLQAHPFATLHVADGPGALSAMQGPGRGETEIKHPRDLQPQQASHPEPSASTRDVVPSTPRLSLPPRSSDHAQSLSQRALRAASGSALPVSPLRASTSLAASQSARNVSVPKARQLRSPTAFRRSESSHGADRGVDTIRTVELIERFPQPPTPPDAGQPQKIVEQRRSVYNLFPRSNVAGPQGSGLRGLLFGAESGSAAGSTSARKLRKRSAVSFDLSTADPRPSGKANAVAEGAPCPMADAGNPHTSVSARNQCNASDETGNTHEVTVRGESGARYRHSGTPIYELDAASLHSFDERIEQCGRARAQYNGLPSVVNAGRHNQPSRNTSGQTDTSRYFSAASATSNRAESLNVLTSPDAHAANSPNRNETERAVANGAHRFVRRKPVPQQAGPQAVGSRPTDDEAGSAPASRAPQATLDTTTPHDPTTPTAEQTNSDHLTENTCPHARATTTTTRRLCPHFLTSAFHRNAAVRVPPHHHQLDGPPLPLTPTPTAITQHPHIRYARNRGTWRSRMQRTKCWHCELDRQKAKGLARLKAALGWTCFCRFENYENDSSSDEEDVSRGPVGMVPMLGSTG